MDCPCSFLQMIQRFERWVHFMSYVIFFEEYYFSFPIGLNNPFYKNLMGSYI